MDTSHLHNDPVYEVDVAVSASDVGLHHPGEDAVPCEHCHVAPLNPGDHHVPAPHHFHSPPLCELPQPQPRPRHQVALQGVLGQVARLLPQVPVEGGLLPAELFPGLVRGNKVGEVCLILTQPIIKVLQLAKFICFPKKRFSLFLIKRNIKFLNLHRSVSINFVYLANSCSLILSPRVW